MLPHHAAVKVDLSLTLDTYRRSSSDVPELVATTSVTNVDVLTVELRGDSDNGSILESDFRMEHFTFYDLTTQSEVINNNPFPGTCEPRDALSPRSVVEIQSSRPLVTSRILDDISPLSDPVRQLEAGHEYRITLKPQRLCCFAMSKEELFESKHVMPISDLPDHVMLTIESAAELRLKVEE